MNRLAGALRAIAAPFALILVPDSSEEAAIIFGLVLVSAALVLAGYLPLAVGVPGAVYVLIGLGFKFGRRP
jgi:hypothetical protein